MTLAARIAPVSTQPSCRAGRKPPDTRTLDLFHLGALQFRRRQLICSGCSEHSRRTTDFAQAAVAVVRDRAPWSTSKPTSVRLMRRWHRRRGVELDDVDAIRLRTAARCWHDEHTKTHWARIGVDLNAALRCALRAGDSLARASFAGRAILRRPSRQSVRPGTGVSRTAP
jgi:hypothetical protein